MDNDSKRQVVETQMSREQLSGSATKRRRNELRSLLGATGREMPFSSIYAMKRAYRWMDRLAQGSSSDLRTVFFNNGRGL